MIFDIGANEGNWTLANLTNSDKFICVEASPSAFGKLTRKHSSNPKVVCLNYAVSNRESEDLTFYECVSDVLSTTNKEWFTSPKSRFYSSKFNEISVKSITIDKLIDTYGVPELIKIDVEGGEFEVVSSLSTKVNQLCFEWASELNDITFKCLDHLYSLGFKEFFVQFSDSYTYRPTTYNTINEVKDILSKTEPKNHWGMLWAR
jgi:FkbM family methyltransferase